jgi:hypothetical protein
MKRILPLLAAMIALTTVLPGKAQTGKYYIDGRETTREELLKLPAGTIESMANSVERIARSAYKIKTRRRGTGSGHRATGKKHCDPA